ncbi:MAG: formylglycine-generating enzyme family protein [Bacteroidota bacterium]
MHRTSILSIGLVFFFLAGCALVQPLLNNPESLNTVNSDMLLIEGGTFTMGCADADSACLRREKPQQAVTVSDFLLSEHEVTQGAYRAVMGTNPSVQKRCYDCPVNRVNWYDALDYANRLSTQEGLTPYYVFDERNVTINAGADGYRLPTEAEWEFALRQGAQASATTMLPPSPRDGWFAETSGRRIQRVGQTDPNALGLYDMQGNVWEWCWDTYDTYSGGEHVNPMGPGPTNQTRIVRGGSYLSLARLQRASARDFELYGVRKADVGFRLARNAN